MAPTGHPKGTNSTEAHKPAVLAPIAKHALQKNTQNTRPQRSSLRRAVRESLLDLSAVATVTTPPSSPALILPLPSSAPSTSTSRVNATTQRSSLRRALKESLRDAAAIKTVAMITTTPPPTLPPTPPITPGFMSPKSFTASSSPYSLANTPETPVTLSSISPLNSATAGSSPDSASTPTFLSPLQSSRKSAILQKQKQHLRLLGRKLECLDAKESDNSGHAEIDNGQGRSKHSEVVDKIDINGIPTSRKGWYRVRSIITEAHDRNGHLIYFVDWEGHDPRTGIGWPGSWVNSENVSEAAVREWKDKRAK
ncbi:hypothetical protein F5Y00DRAFT_247181 [Daldinia vernicosa]|uniref:uncharacterized protein n=1 Tax=Daldinia vernicosa TaxID=114800 RepID=UPI002007CBF5|nr:uncharacterized protein F5Y00DRAFT_247181 [Daldinia vernicosa]KAI0845059.1 hypothetical protein F5Y00DRAFT_247181 [Daldinia vernicosa]